MRPNSQPIPARPLPGLRYGPALQRRRRPQARPSFSSLHLKLKNATSHHFTASNSHRCNSSFTGGLLCFGNTINRHKSFGPLLDVNRAKRSNGRTSDFRFDISVSKWPLFIQPNLIFYVVIIVIMLKWPHIHRHGTTVNTFLSNSAICWLIRIITLWLSMWHFIF